MGAMKSVLQTILLVAIIFVLAVLAEQITPLKQLTDFLDRNPQPYKAISMGASIIGWILMAGVIAYGLWTHGKPMTEDEALRFMETNASSPNINRHFKGRVKGREFHTEVTLREIKDAWQSGDWKHDSRWWPIFVGLLALTLIAFGMFGFFFVIGAPLVKLICAGVLAYAVIMTTWAFWNA